MKKRLKWGFSSNGDGWFAFLSDRPGLEVGTVGWGTSTKGMLAGIDKPVGIIVKYRGKKLSLDPKRISVEKGKSEIGKRYENDPDFE